MFLEICMQFHSVVFTLSRQSNKRKVYENNLLCADNKVFVKYQTQVGVYPPLAYALGMNRTLVVTLNHCAQ